MTIHLTRDEADRVDADGRVVLFRAGVAYMPAEMWGRPGPEQLPTRPPAEFVEAAKPCETCGGRDGGIIRHPSPEHPYHEFCPDCLVGSRGIAAVVPCENCARGGGDHPTRSNLECSCNDGLVTVATVVVEFGPDLHDDGQYALSIRKVDQ